MTRSTPSAPARSRAARSSEVAHAPEPDVAGELQRALRGALAAAADPARAPTMQRYMKSAMPFYGVPHPALRVLLRPLLDAHRFPDAAAWRAGARRLWDEAEHREERYAVLGLLGHRAYRGWRDLTALPLYEHLVVTGAWWDLVDELAAHRVGEVLAKHPAEVTARLRAWSVGDDLWLRRTAILAQIRRRADADAPLLFELMAPSLTSKEFFLRKAIGWALRELGRHEPDVVRRYVREHETVLSGLSRREALKHLG